MSRYSLVELWLLIQSRSLMMSFSLFFKDFRFYLAQMQFSHKFFFAYVDCESSIASKIWILFYITSKNMCVLLLLLLLCLSDLIEFL